MARLVAYHEEQIRAMLCTWTPEYLIKAIQHDEQPFGATLSNEERNAILSIAHDWMQRALGHMLLRDAIWVDLPRGMRIYDILCNAFSTGHYVLPAGETVDLSQWCGIILEPHEAQTLVQIIYNGKHGETRETTTTSQWQQTVELEHPVPPEQQALDTLIEQAKASGLALACYEGDKPTYPFPDDLDTLLPPPPPPYVDPASRFRPPSGWRRTLAFSLVIIGVLVLGVPLLMGKVPVQPAGLPLGLLTLGLLVGIRAGWFGYLGGGGVWLIANLPSFHHNAETTWGLIPFLVAGLFLMALDKNVRILWHWIWFRKREIGNDKRNDE